MTSSSARSLRTGRRRRRRSGARCRCSGRPGRQRSSPRSACPGRSARLATAHRDDDVGGFDHIRVELGRLLGGGRQAPVGERPDSEKASPPSPCGDVKPQLLGVCAQRRGLRRDRLVLLLPGRRHPGVDRRTGHAPGHAVGHAVGHAGVVLPGRPDRFGPDVVAREWCEPPTNPWPRGGRTRTASRPPGRSPARALPVIPRQELGQRLRHHGGDRAARPPCPIPHPGRQRRRQPHCEHRRNLGNDRRPVLRGTLDIPTCLPRRAAEPRSQHPYGLDHRCPSAEQLGGRVDPPGVLPSVDPATPSSHAIKVLPVMSRTVRDAPGPFQPAVT